MANENIGSKIEQVVLTPKPELPPEKNINQPQEKVVDSLKIEKINKNEGTTSKEVSEGAAPASTSTVPTITDAYHQRREKEIDNFLSDGLSETFLAMSPAKQKIFKEEGEKTAKKINILLDATKINIGKIINLIRRWLSLITGANRFFLDQEAKIKTDKIIKMKNKI